MTTTITTSTHPHIRCSDLRRLRRRGLVACMTLAFGAVAAPSQATPLYVTSCADDSGSGTLREVVLNAVAGDTIDAYSQSKCSKITLTQGEVIVLVDDITIYGPASGTMTIDGNQNGRVFDSDNALHLSHLYLTGGRTNSAEGGGCVAAHTLYLDDSVVTGCSASYHFGTHGGGVTGSTVHLTNSLVANNAAYGTDMTAGPVGGGVGTGNFYCTSSTITGNKSVATYSRSGGVDIGGNATITGCTIDSNSSAYYAAFWASNTNSTVTITNSTISGNSASRSTGGFTISGALIMRNSTVAQNSSAYCGGIRAGGSVTMESSIVAGNLSAQSGCVDIRSGAIVGNNNLVSVVNTPVPADTIVANPLLTALADHGGPTRTHGLSQNSPAIDHGSNSTGLTTDQRGAGYARDVGSATDIGAFERQADDDEIFYGSFD